MTRSLYTRTVLPSGRVRYRYAGEQDYDRPAWPPGQHLVTVREGGVTSYRYNVPDGVALAALAVLEAERGSIVAAMRAALDGELMPDTETNRRAYDAFIAAGGDPVTMLRRGTAYHALDALVKRLREIADGAP